MMKRMIRSVSCVLFGFIFLTPVFAQDDKNPLTAEQIIEKHFTAIGGKDKLKAVKSRVALGTIKTVSQAIPVPFILFTESPNRLSVFYRLEKIDWNLTFDGAKFFSNPHELLSKNIVLLGNSPKLENKFSEMYSSGLMFGSTSLYNILLNPDPGVTMKANKTKKISGRLAYLIELSGKKIGQMKVFFDTETFMWIRTDYGNVELTDTKLTLNNSGGLSTTLDFSIEASDFREVGGIKLPYKFKHTMIPPVSPNNRSSIVDIQIDEYQQNVPIDPKMFQYKPADR